MKIYTGYFAKIKEYKEAGLIPISIARFTPKWYDGDEEKYFAPSFRLLSRYKDKEIDIQDYTKDYLEGLDKDSVHFHLKLIQQKNNNQPIVLCCYEKPADFCHRHLLADYIKRELKVQVTEFDTTKNKEQNDNTPTLFGITKGIICQQVNCQNAMGAGLAKAIYEQYPIVKEKYHEAFNHSSKSGMFGRYQVIEIAPELFVANIFSQYKYGNAIKNGLVYTDQGKLIAALSSISQKYPLQNIYIPEKIGCGLAGGNWKLIKEQIDELKATNLYYLNTYTCEIEPAYIEDKEDINEAKKKTNVLPSSPITAVEIANSLGVNPNNEELKEELHDTLYEEADEPDI